MPINKDLAIQTVGLSKRFGKITALDSLNLEIEPHSIYGFLGPNGSGKTTAIRLMLGLSRPSNGNAYIHGFSCARRHVESRQIIGYLPDVPNFFGYMSGLDYLVLCGKLFGLDNKDALNRAWSLLELTGVKDAAHRKANGYSRGMKQRLGLAAAMMGNPKVLFLDEPVSAMDPLGRADVLDIIKGIKEKATVFLSTHILSDVERVSDKVGIIDHGRLITSASIQELKQQFSQNCITVNTLEEPTPLVELIKTQEWCSDVISKQNERGMSELVIYLKDPIAARDNLPKLIIQQNFTIINYVTTLPSLEDIFIKLAGAK